MNIETAVKRVLAAIPDGWQCNVVTVHRLSRLEGRGWRESYRATLFVGGQTAGEAKADAPERLVEAVRAAIRQIEQVLNRKGVRGDAD